MRRGLADNRTQAGRLVEAGQVMVSGAVADKPARLVAPGEALTLAGPRPRFVGRGGEKLHAALVGFGLDVHGCAALDAGASTGGFTDCLLQAGAARVTAVDVGRGQLHERLRADPRVEVVERTDIRRFDWSRHFAVVVADLSFISLRSVASVLVGAVEPLGSLVVLVKPQFEAGRQAVSQGRGIIRDPQIWAGALEGVITAMEQAGATTMGVMVSPLPGAEGNVEFLAWMSPAGVSPPNGAGGDGCPGAAVAAPPPPGGDRVAAMIDAAVADGRDRFARRG